MFEDTDDIVETWYEIFNAVLNTHTPLKEKRIKRKFQPKWFSADLNEEIKLRDCLLKKAVRSQLAKDWSLFKKVKNKVTRLIRQPKKAILKQ